MKKKLMFVLGLVVLVGSLASAGPTVVVKVSPVIKPMSISCGGNGC